MFPLNVRQFASTFLDVRRNMRGYVDEIRASDREATRGLLAPFLSTSRATRNVHENTSVPACHRLGTKMWAFASEATAMDVSLPEEESEKYSQSLSLDHNVDESLRGSTVEEFHGSLVKAFQSPVSKEHVRTGDKESVKQSLNNSNQPKLASTYEVRNGCCVEKQSSSYLNAEEASSQSDTTANVRRQFSIGSSPCDCHGTSNLQQNILMSEKAEEVEYSLYSNTWENFSTSQNMESQKEDTTDSCPESPQKEIVHFNENPLAHNVHITSWDYYKEWNFSFNEKKKDKHNETNQSLFKNHGRRENIDFKDQLCVKPLPLLKPTEHPNRKMPLSSRMLSLNLKALKSVIQPKTKHCINAGNSEMQLFGKVAVLFGCDETGTSVFESEVVGIYDYVGGTVLRVDCLLDANNLQETKIPLPGIGPYTDLDVFLSRLCNIHQASPRKAAISGNTIIPHLPVAWLLTSSALGVRLDWQLQAKIKQFIKNLSNGRSPKVELAVSTEINVCPQWYDILVVLDEYRCVEEGVPLIEVYELCGDGLVKLVNFDIN